MADAFGPALGVHLGPLYNDRCFAKGAFMASKLSAALLLYRHTEGRRLEVLLGHMGGPFWARKDEGGWSIPKGEYDAGADVLAVAKREFEEELGVPPPQGDLTELGELRQPSGKVIIAWAIEGDFAAETCRSNTFQMEWPKGSGRMQEFPEIDRAEWFDIPTARTKLVKGQVPFLDRLMQTVSADSAATT